MIPAAVDYHRPEAMAGAFAALAAEDAKILAGGHSLIPLMKLRLARPSVLVDVSRVVPTGIQVGQQEGARIGAFTTWRDLAAAAELTGCYSALRACAASVGDIQVRNRGTIGGGLCHADPSADVPAALLALGATVIIASPGAERSEQFDGFVTAPFEPALAGQDIVTHVCLPPQPAGASSAYQYVADAASGYPIAGAAALVVVEDGKIASCQLGLAGVAAVPFRPLAAESAVPGWAASAGWADLRWRVSSACDGIDVLGDRRADAGYRAAMARLVTARAIRQAFHQAAISGRAA